MVADGQRPPGAGQWLRPQLPGSSNVLARPRAAPKEPATSSAGRQPSRGESDTGSRLSRWDLVVLAGLACLALSCFSSRPFPDCCLLTYSKERRPRQRVRQRTQASCGHFTSSHKRKSPMWTKVLYSTSLVMALLPLLHPEQYSWAAAMTLSD